MTAYTAPPIAVGPLRDEHRAELVFEGVEQAGPSFEARVFLNNPSADESTPRTPDAGYAGSFHVYGYGAQAPPAMAEAKARQAPDAGPVAPIEKRVHADEGALRAALEHGDQLTVTVVPISGDSEGVTPERLFERVNVVFGP